MRFNTVNQHQATVNHAGANAFTLTPELELYSAVVTTMLSDVTYENADQRLERIRELAYTVSPLFLAKLAVYAREQMHLRTAPVVLIGDLAMRHNGDDLVSRTVSRVVQRPDEITELLAYYQAANFRTGAKKLNRLSKQIQKGLAQSFNRFDAYQFAKYDRKTAVTLRDALFLVHPKAKDEAQQAVFNQIATQSLETPYTWETELSALGQQVFASEKAKRKAIQGKWHELIDSGRLGYMAMLRNLRNMLEADIDGAHVKTVYARLSNEQAVGKAKQLPFRFLAAFRELKSVNSGHVSLIQQALEKALQASTANLRGFDTDTRVVIACDVSGSMQKAVSAKSRVLLYDIGLLLGMLLQANCGNVICGMFGDSWKVVPLQGKNALANVDAFYRREGEVGYSTNGYLVLDDLIRRKHRADKVMLFTDTQLWDSTTGNRSAKNTLAAKWLAYKQLFPNARLYLFDLAGYGQAPLRTQANDVYLIAGWSDKIFDVLQAIEGGDQALSKINEIGL
ncbi:TROVE domain-containing protein [Fibrella arboris]|uniref:TROVE domain-containing protein n=1 Tax=Fibrella arboris TaxID=3242486 RepID=UPI00352290D8